MPCVKTTLFFVAIWSTLGTAISGDSTLGGGVLGNSLFTVRRSRLMGSPVLGYGDGGWGSLMAAVKSWMSNFSSSVEDRLGMEQHVG